jgi:murein L,D-transpeptidase YafK
MNLKLATSLIALSLALMACDQAGSRGDSTRHLKPLSAKAQTELDKKGMTKTSPVLMKIFKQESELEVWKQTANGRYELFKTYPICKWSGELGPKFKEGDRQAPEGFYSVSPAQMNPKSSYYLSFDTGFPNKFDRSYGRFGTNLMVHGDCSSRGCYAMTDEAIAEVYALARDAFEGGQKSFQLQAYPFRMNAKNFARHRNNPHLAFWRNLKEGHDHFMVSKVEPRVEVCEKKYVFNPVLNSGAPVQMQMKTSEGNPWGALKTGSVAPSPPAMSMRQDFIATEKCPTYSTNADIAPLVAAKQAEDNKEIASLIGYGLDAAPVKTGLDGGMHTVYARAQNMPHLDRMANLPETPILPVSTKPGFIAGVGSLFAAKKEEPQSFAPQEPTIVAPVPQPRPATQKFTNLAQ